MEPTLFSILLGRRGWSITPEGETAWARVFLLGVLVDAGCVALVLR